MSSADEIDRLFTLLLSSYRALLASGRVGAADSAAETDVEAHRAAVAAAALHAAVADLLRACSALRLEAAIAEVGAEEEEAPPPLGAAAAAAPEAGGAGAGAGDVWGDMTAARLAELLRQGGGGGGGGGGGAGDAPRSLALTQCRALEQSATAVAVVGGEEAAAAAAAAAAGGGGGGGGGRGGAPPVPPPLRLFLKRASAGLLPPEKCAAALALHARSFRVEQAFYAAVREGGAGGEQQHAAALRAAGAPLPRCLALEERGGVFTTVLEHLDAAPGSAAAGFAEVRVCGRAGAGAVLRWLGAFHGYWWGRALPQGLLRPGGWWRRELKPQVDFGALPGVFAAHCAAFPALGATLDTPEHRALVAGLAARAEALHARAASDPQATLIHGDVKCSNAFFPAGRPAGGSAGASSAPVLFDFQWCGSAATGMADVAYFVCGGVEPGEVLGAGCGALLRVYHEALSSALRARGLAAEAAPAAAGWEATLQAFDRELVTYYTVAAPYLLAGLTPAALPGNRKRYGWLTHEQEEAALWWLTSAVLEALKKWEAAGRVL